MNEEIRQLLADAPGPDEASAAAVRTRAANVLRPAGALTRLDEVAVWLAAWQRTFRLRARLDAPRETDHRC